MLNEGGDIRRWRYKDWQYPFLIKLSAKPLKLKSRTVGFIETEDGNQYADGTLTKENNFLIQIFSTDLRFILSLLVCVGVCVYVMPYLCYGISMENFKGEHRAYLKD